MTDMARPEPGDLLEFFDGEGYVSGTFMEREFPDGEEILILQVGNETQHVHHTDVVSILKRKEDRETDLPLLQERLRFDL